jgi:hypothetical protein
VKTLYKWWAGLLLVCVIVQIGFAGYGAFYAAHKLEDDGTTIDSDKFAHGFGAHIGFGYLIWLLTIVFLIIGIAAGIGRWRLGRHGVLFLLVTLQILLAWIGGGVPAVGFFHPVNALVITAMLVWIVLDTWRAPAAAPPAPAAAPAA